MVTSTKTQQRNLPTAETSRALAPAIEADAQITAVQAIADRYGPLALASKGHFERAIILAKGVQELREALKPFLPDIMALMNNKLGFLTDKDPSKPYKGQVQAPYAAEVVLDCATEALLRGFHLCGNEWNIIRGNFFGAKNGWKRKCEDVQGLTNLQISPGVPRVREGGAIVRIRASWRMNGVRCVLQDEKGDEGRDFAVRLDGGMGVDAAIGKAEARCYKAIFYQATGSTWEEEPVDELPLAEGEIREGKPRTQQVLEQLERKAQPAPTPEPPSNGNGSGKAGARVLRELQEQAARLGWGGDLIDEELARRGFTTLEDLNPTQAQNLLVEWTHLPTPAE